MNRPPSATTSRISVTGRRDYGVKFMADVDEAGGGMAQVDSNFHAPGTAPQDQVRTTYEPPPHWERRLEAGTARLGDEDDEEGCHPFWLGWLDIMTGLGMIFTAVFKLPLVLGHGIAKTLHHIPTLYNDETVRKWPKIDGFPSSCAVSCKVLWYGTVDGLTDWVVLPFKGSKREGPAGFFKGFAKGFGSMIFKPAAGGIGFATHPFYGIYKEAAKFKVVIKRERRRKQTVASLI
ncbi:hypothetical protein GGR54DRAFT_329887 [Hypoxylon sp. NC1633]|nr:hypothetical protein GGR54DRAFT_329887 [Hypoxylon sp. NC1633]